ncbi:MAG: hypothetical protein PHV20_08140 [Bacteroidales bacterium]|nr:hypothetical protein [Bacteroidales bacterium]
MKFNRKIMSLVLCCIFISCNSQNNSKTQSINSRNANNQLDITQSCQKATSTLKYDDYNVVKDTLKINSDDDFIDYPFGCFKKLADLKNQMKNLHYKQECYEDQDKTKLEKFYSGRNYVKFYFVERFIDKKSRYEIVSAKILDNDILLTNGVHIGMSKTEFLSIIPSAIKISNEGINVVELCWDVLGVYHYYSFSNDTLTSIIIDTDFQVNKN